MSSLSLESKKFQDILHNLRLENLSLSSEIQMKVIEAVNSGKAITPELIKGIVANGKV